jgi:hypothetical protein
MLPSDASERYLILIDLSGYTAFLAGVERTHGEDLSAALSAGYRVLGELLQDLVDGLAPEFELVKVEGDALFGTASADALDDRGAAVVGRLGELYRQFPRDATSCRSLPATTVHGLPRGCEPERQDRHPPGLRRPPADRRRGSISSGLP